MTRLPNSISQPLALLRGGRAFARLEREDGQTIVEYGLILLFLVVAVAVAVSFLGDRLGAIFNTIGNSI